MHLSQVHRELSHSLRSLRNRWKFTSLIILCLALGIGANSTIFSVVNAVLLRPLPYADPEQLVILLDIYEGPGGELDEYNVSPANFFNWRRLCRSFTALEAMETRFFNLTGGDVPERIPGLGVTAGLFDLLGVEGIRGRTFHPEEDAPGGARVVVLSHGFWTRRFGAKPEMLGRSVELEGEPYTVIGILPPGFRFLEDAELYVPLGFDPANPPNAQAHYLFVAARLLDGVSVARADSEMELIAEQLAQEFPETNGGWIAKAEGLRENRVGDMSRNLLLLLAGVGFVLLIACANVGNLLLTRAVERQGEMAVRMAFGAGRAHLLRQMLTESVLLALAGGTFGLLLTVTTLGVVPRLLPADQSQLIRDLTIDFRVVVFTFLISLAAGTLPGLLAAWRSSPKDIFLRMREGAQRSSTGMRGRRLQGGLVVVEVALTLLLLIGAGLMIRSLVGLKRSHLGFDPQRLLTLQISLPTSRYLDIAQTTAFWQQVRERVAALPGVESAGVTSVLPVAEFAITTAFHVEGRTEELGEAFMANFRRIDPHYFEALGIPLIEGRAFRFADDHDALPVAIVSETMAERYWPDSEVLGRRIIRSREVEGERWLNVVGVVQDIQDSALGADLSSTFYVPMAQGARPTMFLVVRSSVDSMSLVPAIRKAVLEVDGDQPIAEIETMEQRLATSLSKQRFSTIMFMTFSGLSVALAFIGVYGLLSYSVSQRALEMGIRMTFGASGTDIVFLVLREGLKLTLAGLMIGGVAAFFLTRLLTSSLYEVEPTDPLTFAATAVGLVLIAFAAGFMPAWRAGRYDPAVALKAE